MRINDAVTGAFLTALAIFILVYAQLLPPMPGQPYGAGAFPTVVALGLGAFSLLLAVQAWRIHTPGARWVDVADWARAPRTRLNFFITLALILVYVVFSDRIGFIPLSIAILITLFVRQGVPLARGAVIAVAATLAIQVAFADLLRVPLPRGVLTELLW